MPNYQNKNYGSHQYATMAPPNGIQPHYPQAMAYHPMGPMNGGVQPTIQMSLPSQQAYYAGSPMPSAPQTPFDTSYGATLLPSHLLMGSPFISTPQNAAMMHAGSRGLNSSQQQFYHYTYRNNGKNKGNSKKNNRDKKKVENGHVMMTRYSYPPPPQLNAPPMAHKRKTHLRHETNSQPSSEPYVINFKILPKGDDEYMTRSLLLSNVNASIKLHDFTTKFVKFGPIESVYVVPEEKEEEEEEEKGEEKKQSILLSFLTKNTCLDFYNNVLQKLSDFKVDLNSKSLTLNFVSLTSEDIRDDVLRKGATRSVALEFKNSFTTKQLESIEILSNASNSRFVVEKIDIVNTESPSKNFNTHYAIIHFISISMAVEASSYLLNWDEKLGISRLFFVTDSIINKSDYFRSAPASQDASRSSVSIDQTLEFATKKLQGLVLKERTLSIKPETYPQAEIEEHQHHLTSISISKPLLSSNNNSSSVSLQGNQNLTSSPVTQEMYLHDTSNSTQEDVMIQSSMASGTSNFVPPPPHYYMDATKPIRQTLQQQLTTTAQVASNMGGGLGNRTVYLGNINPRSKPEDICNVVRGGILQHIKFFEHKHVCFVTFIEAAAAVQFFANASIEPIVLHGNVLKVGWGHHPGDLAQSIALAVTIGASRNVYVSLPEYAFKDKFIKDPEFQEFREKYELPSKEQLRQDFSNFGEIEQINYLDDGHCCWVNFMNITSAIKLVEDANGADNEKFHASYQDRYKGLIIGYGKDRCGNVNKNLVANKKSRFFKKVKKASYKIRMHKQNKASGSNGQEPISSFQGNAFGICVSPRGIESEEAEALPDVPQNIEEEKKPQNNGLLKLANGNGIGEGLGIEFSPGLNKEGHEGDDEFDCIQQENGFDGKNDDESYSSDSSDIDIIVSAPEQSSAEEDDDKRSVTSYTNGHPTNRFKKEKSRTKLKRRPTSGLTDLYSLNGFSSMVSSTSLDAVPPLAPSTVSRHYSVASSHSNNSYHNNGRHDASKKRHGGGKGNTHHGRHRKSKAIPGSQVMAQYLAQLQHSTFMYAANILGVTNGDNEESTLYDENGGFRGPM